MSIAKNWTITLNNYTPEELENFKIDHGERIRYICGQEEISASGTPHIQAFASFKVRTRLSGVKKVLGNRLHAVCANGSPSQNRDYCSKSDTAVPDTFFELGEIPENQSGQRNDLEAFKKAVRDDGILSTKRLREEYSEVCAKYPRFVSEYIRDNIPAPALESHALYDWQHQLKARLAEDPNDRDVIFIVDTKGNQGKSWFAHWYCANNENSFLMRPGKHADMAYLVPQPLRTLFLDCTRSQVEYMPYTFLEEMKDGYLMSTKYESCVKKYDKVHVVVLMNQFPDTTALSEDRYVIINL